MKGIILAGGSGSRLYPLTIGISKQLIPIYDKPMIYYPITTLIYAGITEILIISTPDHTPLFKKLLGDGSQFGCKFSYAIQTNPNGLAQAFVLGKEFIGRDKVCLILGDNIFHIKIKNLQNCKNVDGGLIFGYHVKDPRRYGVVEFDNQNNVLSLEEKPKFPKSNFAIPGLYFYDNSVIEKAEKLKPSERGEYEITDINKEFLKDGKLKVKLLPRGSAWLDTGTINSLLKANLYVNVIEERQGRKIGCPEEAAYIMGNIDKKQLISNSKKYKNSGYGDYLKDLTK